MMTLYHGSNQRVSEIDLSFSASGKDFGRGFYLSDNHHQARRMAEIKTLQLEQGTPEVSMYDFDEMLLTSGELQVKIFEGYTREWGQFIYDNRKEQYSGPKYDIVIGPIADDKVGFQIRRLMDGYITLDQFVEELKYAKGMTIQYYFGTQNAINHLHYHADK